MKTPVRVTVTGAAVLTTGGILALWAKGQQAALNDDLAKTNSTGAITGVTWADANERHDRIGRTCTWAAVAAGTGAATAAVGVWWLVTHPKAAVAVVPQGAGVGVVAGSVPETELAEVDLKLRSVAEVLDPSGALLLAAGRAAVPAG